MSDAKGKVSTFARILFVRLRFIMVFVVVGVVVGNWGWITNVVDKLTRPSKADDGVRGEFEFYCPMHPSVVRDAEGKCPICGMPLSKRKRGEKAELPPGVLSRLQLSPFRIQQAGVATVEVGYRPLVREVWAVGFVDYDENRLAHVSTRVAGWLERHLVISGVPVARGQALVEIYSPELVTAQEELLLALRRLDEVRGTPAQTSTERMAEVARDKLRRWAIADEQIRKVEETRQASRTVPLLSPIDGVAVSRHVLAGQHVAEGTELYSVADLTRVWVWVEVFERDVGAATLGQEVEIRGEAHPGEIYTGTISLVFPIMQPETRTVKVRVEMDNPDGKFKPGMFVTAILRTPVGRRAEVRYACPEECGQRPADQPGACSGCSRERVREGGLGLAVPPSARPPEFVYKCPMDDGVLDAPGPCPICGMPLDESYRVAAATLGGRLEYVCPEHDDVTSTGPGICPQDGQALVPRLAPQARVVERFTCGLHPVQTSDGRIVCPDCNHEMRPVEMEEVLAAPFSAVIDTGTRTVVFLDRGQGVFHAVEVTLGPRAGEYYQVLEGLSAGDRVVTAGAFLLDSEARLNPAAGVVYFGASGTETRR